MDVDEVLKMELWLAQGWPSFGLAEIMFIDRIRIQHQLRGISADAETLAPFCEGGD